MPREYRDKWNKWVKTDSESELPSNFLLSYAYQGWDNNNAGNNSLFSFNQASGKKKNGLQTCLQETVKKAANESNLGEAKIAKLMNQVNPVMDGEGGVSKALHKALTRQILSDYKLQIRNDPNFDPERFPDLHRALQRL